MGAAQQQGIVAGGALPGIEGYAGAGQAFLNKTVPEGDWLKEQIAAVEKELAQIGKNRGDMVKAARRCIARLDADLDANKSLSMAAKIQMQAERDVDWQLEQQRSWIGQRLSDLLSMKAA
jgi:hypothetical protein